MKESRSLEFKQDLNSNYLKTVSAFSNFGGGTILFGVDDKGNSVGVSDPDHASMDLENRINDSIHPKPDYSISINRRTNVISLIVSEGRFKPYLYKEKAYRRSDTATVEADQVELRRLTLEGENLYYEALPYQDGELRFEYLESKLKERLGIAGISDDILRTFGLINRQKQYTVAAALFADRNPYPGIDVVRFGPSISIILDRETFSGVSVLQQYAGAVEAFRRNYQYEKIAGISRETVDMIPETAFREAVANALVHRTWDVNAQIRISMYSDRLEISSPGGLPKGISKEEYMNGTISCLRNPMVGNIFFRLHYIEMFGTGIRRIMEAYQHGVRKPDFQISENSITVTLPVLQATPAVTADGRKVVDLLSGGLILSSREIAEQLGWSKDKTIRTLNALHAGGYIQKTGSGRGTKYGKS